MQDAVYAEFQGASFILNISWNPCLIGLHNLVSCGHDTITKTYETRLQLLGLTLKISLSRVSVAK